MDTVEPTQAEYDETISRLQSEVNILRNKNEKFKNAILELEQEKATLAHSFLTSSLRMRMLLQNPMSNGQGDNVVNNNNNHANPT